MRFRLLIIGHAQNLCCFNGKATDDVGFDYRDNKKASMNSELVFGWLKPFSEFGGKTPGSKVILLVDNDSSHGTKYSIVRFQNLATSFLPLNTTSRLQPLDFGIITSLKRRYRNF